MRLSTLHVHRDNNTAVSMPVFSTNCYQAACYGDSCRLWRPYSPPIVTMRLSTVNLKVIDHGFTYDRSRHYRVKAENSHQT